MPHIHIKITEFTPDLIILTREEPRNPKVPGLAPVESQSIVMRNEDFVQLMEVVALYYNTNYGAKLNANKG